MLRKAVNEHLAVYIEPLNGALGFYVNLGCHREICANRQLLVKDESWKLAVIAIHELRESAAPQLCVISHASTFLGKKLKARKTTDFYENYKFLVKILFTERTHYTVRNKKLLRLLNF